MKTTRYATIVLVSVVLIFSFLLSCARGASTVPLPSAPGREVLQPAASVEASSEPAWQQRWERLIQDARKEKEVVVYAAAFPPEVSRWMSAAFQRQFGVQLVITSGPSLAQVEKVFRERKAGLFLSDVWLGGPTNNLIELKPARVLQPLDDVLFLPEVTDRSLWMSPGEGPFFDRDHYIAIGMNSVQPMLGGNSQLVRPGEVKSLKDLLDPKWRGKIAIGDPAQGGSKTALIWVYRLMGDGFMRELIDQQPAIIRDKRQLVEWVARGKASFALGISQDMMAEFRRAGASVEYFPVEQGMLITYGATSASFFEKAPHPNGARLLLNWMFTRNSQTEWGRLHDMASRRKDVSNDWIEPVRRVQPSGKYHATDEDFYLTQEKDVKAIMEIFKPVM